MYTSEGIMELIGMILSTGWNFLKNTYILEGVSLYHVLVASIGLSILAMVLVITLGGSPDVD